MPPSAPSELRRLAAALVRMQPLRNGADYNPTMRFTKKSVLVYVEEARRILEDLANIAPSDKCAFAVHMLFKERRD